MAGLPVRRAPYKDFLQPALQRRFASTAVVLLLVSYVEAVCLTKWESFLWSWFPLGPAGFRTATIFTCSLPILILRIANYHVGLRTTGGGFHTLSANLTRFSTWETVLFYYVSSAIFGLVFLWSANGANLDWIVYLSGNRAKLNERPLFLACYLGCCALYQSVEHFKEDIDQLDLTWLAADGKKEASDAPAQIARVLSRAPFVLMQSIQRATGILLVSIFVYFFGLRPIAWRWALMAFRPFYNLPATSIVPNTWAVDLFVLGRCLYAGSLLLLAWSMGNISFSIFMAKAPLKNGQPLTSESKDPNGSLLNGLKSKKLPVKCFAMWELANIAKNFDTRRQAIYADIDRKEGPMWAQVYSICLDTIRSIEARVDEYGKPSAPTQPVAAPVPEKPRVLPPLRDDPVFANGKAAPETTGDKVKKITSRPGDTPMSKLSPLAKKTWTHAKDRMLSKEQRDAVAPEQLRSQFQQVSLTWFTVPWIGALFKREYRQELAGAVLGQPYAEASLYVNAASALCNLAVHSLGEDQFGNVHRDVPSIIRTLTSVIRKVDALKQTFPVHWTDVNSSKNSLEVDQVMDALRSGLEQVVESFEAYSLDLRLTQTDLRLAKDAAYKPPVAVPEVKDKGKKPEIEAPAPRQELRKREGRPEMEQVR